MASSAQEHYWHPVNYACLQVQMPVDNSSLLVTFEKQFVFLLL